MSDELTNVQRLQRGLELFLSKDMKGWTDLCAEDVVAEFPFAPEGSPSVIEGRAALYEYLRGYPETIDVRELPTTTMYATGDPDLVVMEWSVAGTVVRTGNPYAMRYATFVTFRDGEIATYREYWNPQVFLAALDGQGF
ncbi:nuclear transport factor 2 family protein [Arthrobacter crusticola]|uniref:Nuclear transport factor 2 family protein n=1 Tax=Arthrobacter crusticola TaxID=2547960 RepID=A0A4R5TM15_9MICC|nr:nuclear transport factor 2 family protein [Arthrobacter crusticola]TDK23671.1 nuclear transport factor 2 family protein [Arthrobacter crusticola]